MERTFVYAELFERALKALVDGEQILDLIEHSILENPKVGDVIPGTSGVRKLRVQDASRGKGKRGGYRALYLDLPMVERTHMLVLYSKNQADDLSTSGKKVIRDLVAEIKGEEL